MTRQRNLREVLNVRLDDALAREIRRIAAAQGGSESEVARTLLSYGAEVARRLEAQRLMSHYTSREPEFGRVVIDAHWEPLSDEELAEHGL